MKMVNEKCKSSPKLGKLSSRSHCLLYILYYVFGFSLAILVSSYFKTFPPFINFDSTLYSLAFSVSSPHLSSSAMPPIPSSPPPPHVPLPAPLLSPLSVPQSSPPPPFSPPTITPSSPSPLPLPPPPITLSPPLPVSLPPPLSSPSTITPSPPPPVSLPPPPSSPPTITPFPPSSVPLPPPPITPSPPLLVPLPPQPSSPPTRTPSPPTRTPSPPPPSSPSTITPYLPPEIPISPPSPYLRPMSFPPQATPISPPSPSLPSLMPPQPEMESFPSKIGNDSIVSLMHNMSDEELFAKAINVSKSSLELDEDKRVVKKKVAYMFLTHGALPLAPLWEKYFEGNEGLYSIYVHPHPSYNYSWPSSSVFFNRRIPSQPVTWGTDSMMAAERRLLANSLLDISNQRFVLLSESCIPLSNFKTTYDYLMNSNLSFVESYDNPKKPGRGRYNSQMSPHINITHWRKGSQWFEATRDLTLKIVSDQKYYKIFQDYCLPPCYFDEHYIPTLLNIVYPKLSTNRTITYVDWSRGGPHPLKFGKGQITDEFINRIRYGSECVYNGNTTTMCFMFARKFAPNALEPLLRIAPSLLGFDH